MLRIRHLVYVYEEFLKGAAFFNRCDLILRTLLLQEVGYGLWTGIGFRLSQFG